VSFSFALLAVTMGMFSGCSRVEINVSRLAPPKYDLAPGKRLAVLPFEGTYERRDAGITMSNALLSHLAPIGFYRLVERAQVKRIMDEQTFSSTDFVDPSTAIKVGNLLGAEYLIVGTVTSYSIEDSRTTEYQQQTQFTGRYDYNGNPIYTSITVPVPVLIRRAVVGADFRLLDANDGSIIASSNESEPYQATAKGANNIGMVPPAEQILRDLTGIVSGRFFSKISAHQVVEPRVLFKGKTRECKDGVELAKNGLWPEAANKWEAAQLLRPDDFAPFHNMGVEAEVRGDYREAERKYQEALTRKPGKKDVMFHLQTSRRIISDMARAARAAAEQERRQQSHYPPGSRDPILNNH
jgi:hypothetical protein